MRETIDCRSEMIDEQFLGMKDMKSCHWCKVDVIQWKI